MLALKCWKLPENQSKCRFAFASCIITYAMQLLHLRSRSWRDSTPLLQSQANLVNSKRFKDSMLMKLECVLEVPVPSWKRKQLKTLCSFVRPAGPWSLGFCREAPATQPNPTHFNQFSKYYSLSCLTQKPQAHFVLLATRFQYLQLHVLFREWIVDVILAFLTCILSQYLIQTS